MKTITEFKQYILNNKKMASDESLIEGELSTKDKIKKTTDNN
jgi:hypothetical protein